ncbi:MAG TPA: Ig-like domain-containing protein [Chryseolinea sp.]
MNLRKHLHWLLYPLFFLACARQTTPTGGPKDSLAPVLVASLPKHEQTKFKGKSVELTFNEAVQVNNPKEQIIIIPSIGKDFEATAKKNKVVLTFKDNTKDSTTYSINFRESVQDLTEKNPAENLKLAFSTGDYIDSLSIEGFIFDPLKGKESKDATVALFQSDTFNIFKHKPVYLTKTSEKGNYIIENLKPGDYYLYAMEDKNKNLLVDSKSETYGFIAKKITLTEDIKKEDIPVIKLDTRALKLTNSRPYNTYFNIKTSKNLDHYRLTPTEGEILLSAFAEDQANIRIYNTIEDKDSLAVRFNAYDSVSNAIDTTIYIKFSKRDVKKETFKVTSSQFKVIGTKGILKGSIIFNKPVAAINFDSIYYQIDSAKVVPILAENIKIDSAHNTVIIEKTFDKTLFPKKPDPSSEPPKKKEAPKPPPKPAIAAAPAQDPKKPVPPPKPVQNQFIMSKGTFISVELDSSAASRETLKPSILEDTGIIFVEVKTDQKNFVIQLLNKDFKPVASRTNTTKTSFEDLDPGDYMIRLIIDKDGDGKWSPGNFQLHQEPEPIVFYKNEKKTQVVNLKANWELGPLLISY